ncbi:MAG TPA: hypothetical protein VMW47_13535 [Verrucomicrobiae bacterium]|nr:hypothetical protein [Verrucomicrobiae bacterium]
MARNDASDPRGLFGALHGLRCCGAVLERHGGRWRLAATINPSGQRSIWHDRASWDADCDEWLRPLLPRLQELLRGLETT